jgi:hypothetical protein
LGLNAPLGIGSGSTTLTTSSKNVFLIGSAQMTVSPVITMGNVCLVKIQSLTPISCRFLMIMYSVEIVHQGASHVRDLINSNALATKINSEELQFMIMHFNFVYLGLLVLLIVLIATQTESVQNAKKNID